MARRSFVPALLMLLLFAAFPLNTQASYTDNPPAQPGFTRTTKLSADDTGYGIQLSGAAIGRGAPTIADVDGNPGNGKEIVIGGTDGRLYVIGKNGQVLRAIQVAPACPAAGWPDGMINTAPAVGPLYGDGVPYIVVGYGTVNLYPGCTAGGIVAYRGTDGAEVWRYPLTNPNEMLHGVFSSPALADVNGDGKLEVGVGTLERDVLLLSHDGRKLWRFHNADTVISSPAFTDVNGDGLPDMIIGSDISANPRLNPPTYDGGYVTAFRGTDGTILWRNFYNQTIYSSPVIADVNRDGAQDVVIGSGCFFTPRRTRGNWVKILNASNGAEIRTLNADSCINATPAVADLNGDGKTEIAALVDGSETGQSTLTIWDWDNPTPKRKTVPLNSVPGLNDKNLFNDLRSAVIADIDGNGSLEIVAANYGDVTIFDSSGNQLTCRGCNQNPGVALFAWHPLASTPAIGDLDGDGDLEIVIGGTHQGDSSQRAFVYAWTNLGARFNTASGNQPAYSAPWPSFRGNPLNSGAARALNVSPRAIGFLLARNGGARSLLVRVSDVAGGAFGWSASENASWLSISPASGGTPTLLRISADPSGLGNGTYTGTVNVDSAYGSSTVSVRLTVVDRVLETHLPFAAR
jgi:hypothetical protein